MHAFQRALCAGVIAVCALQAHARAPAPAANLAATRQYYGELVSGPAPRTAELNLLMTMLPKGGDLHHHYSGSIYAETYLEWIGRKGWCVYRESDPAANARKYNIETRTPPAFEPPKSCLKLDAIRRDNGFYREILSQWSDKDFDNHVHAQVPPDQHFFDTFPKFGPASALFTREGLLQLKARAKAENMQYLETMLRSAPGTDHPELAARIDALPPDADEATVFQALAAYADFLASDDTAKQRIDDYVKGIEADAGGLDDEDFTLRIQTYVSRNSAPSKVFAGLYAAFAADAQSPLLVGVNIVGPENGYVALRDYRLHMRMFRFLKQRFPQVRLSLHAGELVLGMVPPEDLRSHIRDAIEIAGAERIGHGIGITWEDGADELLEAMRVRNIPVEINITSNAFILGVKNEAHPLTVYKRHGVPIVISTDDSGVSRNNISCEYLLYTTRYRPSYDTLKQTVYNSIRYAFLDPKEKRVQLERLDRRFLAFEATTARIARAAARQAGKRKAGVR